MLLSVSFVLGSMMLAQSAGPARPAMADAHRLKLEGAYNFRDLGGYRTSDGKQVKKGMLYRSENLASLTDRDYEQLAALQIKVLCDFRGADEKKRQPTKWRGSMIEEFPQPIEAQSGSSPLMAKLMSGAPPAELKAVMTSLYGDFATKNVPQYARLMRRIADGGVPVLYHCTAGKDRTGVFTAMLLATLGVPRATVMEDYLQTNQYVMTPEAIERMSASMRGMGMNAPADATALRPVLGVEREYLEAVFAKIDQEYGSFDQFREKALGMTKLDVEKMRRMLLE